MLYIIFPYYVHFKAHKQVSLIQSYNLLQEPWMESHWNNIWFHIQTSDAFVPSSKIEIKLNFSLETFWIV